MLCFKKNVTLSEILFSFKDTSHIPYLIILYVNKEMNIQG